MKLRLAFAVAITGCLSFHTAEATPGVPKLPLERATWKASWITADGAAARDSVVVHFRKRFTLAESPLHFLVHVSADNRFVLHVNGKVVGKGPARGDLQHWRYETYDLASVLQTGDNVIAATVWNFGNNAAYAQISRRTGFLLQSRDEAHAFINSNKNWEAKVESGHAVNVAGLSAIREKHYFYAASPPERRDGNIWDWNWDRPAKQANLWPNAVAFEKGTPGTIRDGAPHELSPPGWVLMPDPLPAMEEAPITFGRIVRKDGALAIKGNFFDKGTIEIPAHSTTRILLDRQEIVNAYPNITLRGGRNAVIRLTYAESLFDRNGRKGNRNEIEGKEMVGLYDEFVSDGQEHSYGPLWWRSWRFLQVHVETSDEPLTIVSLTGQSTLFPLKRLATFASSDPDLEKLWDMAFRTLRISAWETYMDSPYWEQLQYIGDTRITALLSYALSNEDRLARQALLAFDQSRTNEGLTMSRYPTRDQQYIPPYSLFWVGMVHDFWMYRDDPDFVRSLLPGTRTVLDWFLARVGTDGLPSYLPYWAHIDPAAGGARQTDDGGSGAAAAQLIMALREAAALERKLGDIHRAETYVAAAARTSKAMRALWDEKRGLLRDNPDSHNFSHDLNILALDQDVLSGTQQQRLAREVLSLGQQAPGSKPAAGEAAPASLYFRYYLHHALVHAKQGDSFLELLAPWKQMLTMGLSTFPEFSDPTRSDSHAWTAHPALDLLSIAAGITPFAPGFAKVQIAPNPGSLDSLNVSMPHPRGEIRVSLQKNSNGWVADVQLPAGTPGEFLWQGRSFNLKTAATTKLTLPPRK